MARQREKREADEGRSVAKGLLRKGNGNPLSLRGLGQCSCPMRHRLSWQGIAAIGGFWREMARSRMTQLRH